MGCNKSWCNCRRGRLCGVHALCWEDAMSMTSINDPDRLASSSSSIRPALAPTAQSPKGDTSSFYRRHQPDRRAPFDAHDLMHRQHTNRLAKWRSTRPTTAGSHIRFIKFLFFVSFFFFHFWKRNFWLLIWYYLYTIPFAFHPVRLLIYSCWIFVLFTIYFPWICPRVRSISIDYHSSWRLIDNGDFFLFR